MTRIARLAVPDEPEVGGLLALMLLTDARRPARADARGELVPLDEQDRSRSDAAAIAEGDALITEAMAHGSRRPLPAAGRDRRAPRPGRRAGDTDWGEILALYGLLER